MLNTLHESEVRGGGTELILRGIVQHRSPCVFTERINARIQILDARIVGEHVQAHLFPRALTSLV